MNMKKSILLTPLAVLLAVGTSGIYASAQDITSAVLMGTVTGPDGKPLPNVRVYLTSGALLTPRDGRTDANGRFSFRLLPSGRYTITYSMDGFISRKVEMSLLPGMSANGDIRLRAMDVQGAAIEIVAEVSNVITPDKTDTAVQTAFTSDRLEEIGGGRGVGALQALTPGLYGTIDGGAMASNTFSIRGGLGRGNKIIQDGQVVNDALRGTYFNAGDTIEDLIESVAVIQSPLNAKLGNTDGGIISITTKRGGNTFSGSLRYGGTRGVSDQGTNDNAWKTSRHPYPDARGYMPTISAPPNDLFSKNWQYSITGPIIPNYLTFAVGGNLKPTTDERRRWGAAGTPSWAQNAWSENRWGNPSIRYQQFLGTFYLDNDPTSPGYGDVIRKSYWGDANGPDEWMYMRTSGGTYTFNLYLQATPNHQFSWYYSQNNSSTIGVGSTLMENPADNLTEQSTISWNVSYKAVLGASGVFDARFGKSNSFSYSPRRGNEAVRVYTYRSYMTAENQSDDWYYGSWDQIANLTPGSYDPSARTGTGWVSSGMIDDWWNGFNQSFRGASPFSSIGEENASGSNGSSIISANANYQHMLDFKGSHIIDIGWNMNQVDAPGIPERARITASPVGQIAAGDQLNNYHIGNTDPTWNWNNPNGPYAGGHPKRDASYYAGKYIVFDVVRPNGQGTLISQLEPHVLTRPTMNNGASAGMLTDGYIWNPGYLDGNFWVNGTLHSQLSGFSRDYMPFMYERWGSDGGEMRTTTSSVYVNDMWTIDEHHSVMVGLRADIFSLKDSARTVHSYTKITPRLEYKFDLNGDQRHLFATSLAQFHQMPAANVFWPFIETRWANTSQRFWTGAALSDPTLRKSGYYLVGYNDIMNPANYTEEFNSIMSGREFGDVDKNFRPPTSTEFSVWYRHTFPSGGSFKVSFNNRSWSDVYELFPSDVFQWKNPANNSVQNRIKAVLKNTDEFQRTYNGIELQWDFPITRKISFGGNYTYSRFLSNQTMISSSEAYIGEGGTAPRNMTLQTPWWFDELFNRDVVDADGNFLYNFGGRRAWSPMQSQAEEFRLGYYLIVNLTQGKARSNFTLRGTYTGGSIKYDSVGIRTGRYVMPPGKDENGNDIYWNQYPGQAGQGGNLVASTSAFFGQYTTNDSFSNDFSYNLNMPVAKRLSWFVNISVSNFFNHQPYSSSVPGGAGSGSTITPWPYRTGAGADAWANLAWNAPFRPDGAPSNFPVQNWNAAPRNPFVEGWNWTPGGDGVGGANSRYFYKGWSVQRSITMSTGIRF
jgi:hypothetical protein